MFGTIQSFITNCNLRQGLETLTTVHQILKLMDVLTCMKRRRGRVRLSTWIIGKMPGRCFYFRAAAHGLNCCRTELIIHRICVNGGNTTRHCEMSGPLSHTAPDSIVYCLGPGVEPPTYKSKVWTRSWGQESGPDAAPSWPGNSSWLLFPHCKSSQTSWPAAAVIKATMPGPSMSLHPVQMAVQFVCSVDIRVHFSS